MGALTVAPAITAKVPPSARLRKRRRLIFRFAHWSSSVTGIPPDGSRGGARCAYSSFFPVGRLELERENLVRSFETFDVVDDSARSDGAAPIDRDQKR